MFDLFCDLSMSSLVEIDRYFGENSFMLLFVKAEVWNQTMRFLDIVDY